MALAYDLIGLLVPREDYSMRELFKHITVSSPHSSEGEKQVELNRRCSGLMSNGRGGAAHSKHECFTPTHDRDTKVKATDFSADNVTHSCKTARLIQSGTDRAQ